MLSERFCKKISFLFVFLLLIVMVSACSQEKKTKDKPAIPVKISAVKMYVDNSESNMGYLKGSTRFKKIINDLVVHIGSSQKLELAFIDEKIQPYAQSQSQFINDIADGKVKAGLCSEMHNMFEQIIAQSDTNDISIFVSDCILSYCDVSGNPEKNRDNAESNLKPLAKSVFIKLRQKGYHTSVYAFKSEFTGTYITYQNVRDNSYHSISRPFYIWVIGRKDVKAKFDDFLMSNTNFQPEEQLNFSTENKPASDFDILYNFGRKGKWKNNKQNEMSNVSLKDGKPEFTVALNLKNLPAFAQKSDYITKNIAFTENNVKLSLQKVYTQEEIQKQTVKEGEKKYIQDNTHFLVFRLEDLIGAKGSAKIILKKQTDVWYKDWSTMDDRSKLSNIDKTFAFEHLINGVKEAYDSNTDTFVEINIPFEQ